MYARVFLSTLFVVIIVPESSAQNRFHWRPGMFVEGVADAIGSVTRDLRDGGATPTLAEGDATGAIESQDHRDFQQPQYSGLHRAPDPQSSRHPTQVSPRAARAVSIDDVIALVQRGLGESTIVQHIDDNGVTQRLNVGDLIRLHEQGVSEPIIHTMQTARVVDSEPYPHPVSLGTRRNPVRSVPSPFKPKRPTVDIDRFGPSILVPAQRSHSETRNLQSGELVDARTGG